MYIPGAVGPFYWLVGLFAITSGQWWLNFWFLLLGPLHLIAKADWVAGYLCYQPLHKSLGSARFKEIFPWADMVKSPVLLLVRNHTLYEPQLKKNFGSFALSPLNFGDFPGNRWWNLPCRRPGFWPGWEKILEKGSYPHSKYSWLQNSVDRQT